MTLESSASSRHSRLALALALAAALCIAGCCAFSGQGNEGRAGAPPPSQVTRAAAEADLVEALWSYHEAAITDILKGIENGLYQYNDAGGRDFDRALSFFELVTGIQSSTAGRFGRTITPDLGDTLYLWREWYRDNREQLHFAQDHCEITRTPQAHFYPSVQALVDENEPLTEAQADEAEVIFSGMKPGVVSGFGMVISGFTVGGSVVLKEEELRVSFTTLVRIKRGSNLQSLFGALGREAKRLGAHRLVIEGQLASEIFSSAKAVRVFTELGYSFQNLPTPALIKNL